MLSEKNRIERIDWARKYEKKHWMNAIFCDEASFWLHGGRVKIWTKAEKNAGKLSLSIGKRCTSGQHFIQWELFPYVYSVRI